MQTRLTVSALKRSIKATKKRIRKEESRRSKLTKLLNIQSDLASKYYSYRNDDGPLGDYKHRPIG